MLHHHVAAMLDCGMHQVASQHVTIRRRRYQTQAFLAGLLGAAVERVQP